MIKDEFKKYCSGKNIVIVGNSSSLLNKESCQFIDGHDIVIRINNAYPIKSEYYKNIGKRTDVYCISIARTDIAQYKLKGNQFKYILRLNFFTPDIGNQNIVYGDIGEYRELKSKFDKFKPSTGSILINFFKNNIDFKHLNLIGFNFFENESGFRQNKFGSFLYKEHSRELEKKFIESCLSNNISLIK